MKSQLNVECQKRKPAVKSGFRRKRARPSGMWLAQQTHGLGSEVIFDNNTCNLLSKSHNIFSLSYALTFQTNFISSGFTSTKKDPNKLNLSRS